MPQTTISTIWSRNGIAAATLTKKTALTTKAEATAASRRPPAPQLQPLTAPPWRRPRGPPSTKPAAGLASTGSANCSSGLERIHRYTPVVDVRDEGDSAVVVTKHGEE